MANTRKGKPYAFHITNFVKPDSLFNNGMKPLVYSRKESDLGWYRAGEDIAYYPTPYRQYKPCAAPVALESDACKRPLYPIV